MILNFILVGIGGFLGSMARYAVSLFIQNRFTTGIPLGTLLVNTTGCLLIGIFSAQASKYLPAHSATVLFLTTGLLGGFTTFSAFGLESVVLIQDQHSVVAFGYVFLTVFLGLGAVWIGRALAS